MDDPGDQSKQALREQIAALESDRASLMAAIRHMKGGLLDVSRLSDSLRDRLDQAPSHGVLLDQIETELRHRREHLKIAQEAKDLTTPPALSWPQLKIHFQEIERRVAAGEYTSAEAVHAARACGLLASRPRPSFPHGIQDVMAFVPERWVAIGPWLLVRFEGESAPTIYEPYVPPDLL